MLVKAQTKKKTKNRKIYTYTSDKKDTFLLYISFADVDHDVRDDQHKSCYKMIYNMSIFEKVDFLSFGACAIMKRAQEPSFLTWETWGIICGGCRHPREATCKVSVLLYFFPTNHDFQRSAPRL